MSYRKICQWLGRLSYKQLIWVRFPAFLEPQKMWFVMTLISNPTKISTGLGIEKLLAYGLEICHARISWKFRGLDQDFALMVELVDTLDLKSNSGNRVRVRFPLRA